MLNTTKHDLRLIILHKFKFWPNASETAANNNRAWLDGSKSDWRVRRCFSEIP